MLLIRCNIEEDFGASNNAELGYLKIPKHAKQGRIFLISKGYTSKVANKT